MTPSGKDPAIIDLGGDVVISAPPPLHSLKRAGMGRSYENELELVRATAEWATVLDLSNARPAFERLQGRDLIVVASGGSVAAAQLMAQLHCQRSGCLGSVMTPLEF